MSKGFVFTNQEVRDMLEEILSRPDFILSRLAGSWIDRGTAMAERLLFGILGTDGRIAWWGYVLLLLSVAGLLFLVYFAASRVSRVFFPDRAAAGQESAEPGGTDYNGFRETASRYADAGDYREAVRYLYLSLLMFLDGQQLIQFRMSKTNLDYLGELRKSSADSDRFTGAANFFERKWYGMENCTDTDYREFRAMYLSLVSDWRGSYQNR
ncbi:DUF4129 domain-containing protein [Phosphitispora fastidiosa]|uniref:DUF4129 domain-containing protein n=1 Tax=Phosphitispora fastidiosa TaxID=2837202 RepID=UPI001E56AE35|nr:DUF4129 domain-containing protein [Phosphitispora fastidiosa]MBU7006827.1 hypothetical protein [Phosphitispora fastidiosa]